MMRLDQDLAARLARIALGHVTREYPNKLDHVLAGPEDVRGPRALHPIFYGSFDWHSCVHGYWMLARLLRRFPTMAPAEEIRALFTAQFTPENVEGECAYLRRPAARGFERPYGWAWLLKLAEELSRHEDDRHARLLAPLAGMMADRFKAFLPRATYPLRVGTHFNTGFALTLAADYAEAMEDAGLLAMARDAAWRWHAGDADCQAWEPGGDEFLSPTLMEAECMRRLLPAGEFLPWFIRFLPRLEQRQPATLFTPATVSDRSDGKIVHLDGLNLSRAWCWRSLAAALPEGHPRRALALEAADTHLAAGLPHVAGDYMGEHWLASFAVLALEA
ncbi:DUF2891 domain-containing protein [Roseomonas marmotae]|uniref:DUF2891 domain-containing protein n=1 Tax=Roseomonas marmotae TaxID=2768161 RepID=A0ABS3KHZ4_9PROT|nr:DUF2891 domain-containing protein [Roseomonas marmotae]MBO1077077.1 DUF2891 domain-containing protein [Roseomonas marmotae]QTI81872.1 DUF2891 domain-containing protein [Roseomonas marmotae]